MKFLFDWFKKIFSIEKSTEEEVKNLANGLENVVVGKILEIEKHPNADRLQVTKVDIGPARNASHSDAGGGEVLQIVCGAPNIQVGQVVPVALAGAKLPSGIEIKEAEIRGVKSFGMLCAKDELGLGTDHSGIMVLDDGAEVGMEFAKYTGLI